MSWPTIVYNTVEYYLFEGNILIPVDPTTGAAILMLKAEGYAVGTGIPAIEDGAPGTAATFQEGAITFTELAYDDVTPASMTVTQVSPGVYALSGTLHKGAPGATGTSTVTLAGIGGSAAAGKLIKVNTGVTGFDFTFEKIAERYLPATIANTASGNTNSTLCTISIPSKNFDYRPMVVGYTIVTEYGGPDVLVDLVARLNDETGGNIVARCQGVTGTERLMFAPIPEAGSVDTYDKVTAGTAATIYVRTEKQSGTNSYTTSNSTSRFGVWAIPV